ncbi:MAG: MBL fold metallo-hydrolase [Clostridiales bacterium]|nr:MBL fold metallo-hydrolase [Clostridiales bacterium]
MKITMLSENTSISEDLKSEHGLSVLIQTKDAVVLFDTGASGTFFRNAQKMDVDIADVTHLVISHGHYDHGGGIDTFIQENDKASIHIREEAFGGQYAKRHAGQTEYVGLAKHLMNNGRMIFAQKQTQLMPGITLHSDIKLIEPIPDTNSGLLMEKEGEMLADDFSHEQVMTVEEDGKMLLLTGCSHHGIVNILEHIKKITGREPDVVIGGFHLESHSSGTADDKLLDHIASYLSLTKAQYYTCHCTGLTAYEKLNYRLGDQLQYLSCGQTITIF